MHHPFDFYIVALLLIACFACAVVAGQICSDIRTLAPLPPKMEKSLHWWLGVYSAASATYGTSAALFLARILCP